MRRIADAAVRFLQPRRPDIALIADPQALIHIAHFKTGKDPLTFHMFNEQLREAAKIGASHDLYLLSDLCADLVPEHRLYLFLNDFRMTPNERAAVRKDCLRPGKVVVFLGPAGYSDGANISWENTGALTGSDVVPLPGPVQLTTEIETDGPSGRGGPPWPPSPTTLQTAAGVKKIRLPARRAVVDVFGSRMISPGCKEFEVRLQRHTTALYYAGDRNKARAFLRALDAQEHP